LSPPPPFLSPKLSLKLLLPELGHVHGSRKAFFFFFFFCWFMHMRSLFLMASPRIIRWGPTQHVIPDQPMHAGLTSSRTHSLAEGQTLEHHILSFDLLHVLHLDGAGGVICLEVLDHGRHLSIGQLKRMLSVIHVNMSCLFLMAA
jgi:hypothetical protein